MNNSLVSNSRRRPRRAPQYDTRSNDFSLSTSWIAIREWARLFLIGGFFEAFRRILSFSFRRLEELFLVTAEFDQRDETYFWMMFWLSRQEAWTQARNVIVSTRIFGQNGCTDLIPGEVDSSTDKRKKLMVHLPAHHHPHYLWYNRTFLQVTRLQISAREGWLFWKDQKLVIKMFTRNQDHLNTLLLEAKLLYKAEGKDRVNIYVADEGEGWTLAGSRAKRPLASVVLDKKIKETLLMDCKDFMESEMWYAERGIPWRRGYLLYGSPGSGKSSLVHALAGELGLDIFVIPLSKRGLDDSILNNLISRLPARSIALIEDVDAAFHHGLSRDITIASTQSSVQDTDFSPNVVGGYESPVSAPKITLAGLLAAIDGITAQEGRILFASTNRYEALDSALVRPGRLDVHVRFHLASKWQAEELFRRFYPPDTDDDDDARVLDDGSDVVRSGVVKDWSDLDAEEGGEREDEDEDEDEDISEFSSEESSSTCASSHTLYSTATRSSGITCPLSRAQVNKLAELFASCIPDRAVSMAAIQGHLMKYKKRPRDAVASVDGWIKEALVQAGTCSS